MRQKRTVRASSVWARRGVWLGWAIYYSVARGDYDGPFLSRIKSTQHTSRGAHAYGQLLSRAHVSGEHRGRREVHLSLRQPGRGVLRPLGGSPREKQHHKDQSPPKRPAGLGGPGQSLLL